MRVSKIVENFGTGYSSLQEIINNDLQCVPVGFREVVMTEEVGALPGSTALSLGMAVLIRPGLIDFRFGCITRRKKRKGFLAF